MSLATLFALDLAAIALVAFAIYFPRRRNRDMVVALLGINIGVLGVTQALSSAQISAGLGLGLFGVLSIIRLRSAEMDQSEVAYYFVALTLGLIGGFPVEPAWLSPALMAALLLTVFVGDHPRLFRGYRHQAMTLDRAYLHEHELRRRVGDLLQADAHRLTVRNTDLVNDTTVVDVRYRLRSDAPIEPSYTAAEFGVGR